MSSSRESRSKSRIQVGKGFGDGILKLVKVTLLQLGQLFARHDQVNQSLNTLFMITLGVSRPVSHALTGTKINSPGGPGCSVRPLFELNGKMLDSCEIQGRNIGPCDHVMVM